MRGSYCDFFEKLYESITENKVEPVTAQDGVNVMKIIEAAIKSSKSKKAISINQ
ncbi:Gfo/Idh/MocA family oxidoreductase [Flavobacterium sp. 3HN19-14]|uniref:Gfo/Idh/MocA family oxidoreductase n=1 Tax=Flavobacterium sp. 3HN19-14 TaxID=3448133 RepID=UPI003EE0ABE6